MAIHYAPKPREKREKRKKGGKNAEAAVGEEIAGAGSDAVGYITDVVRHGTARLPELHGLELTLHRHPISHNTYGEPPGLSLLTIGPYHVGHGAPHQERVGQGRLRPLGTHAPTRTPGTTP